MNVEQKKQLEEVREQREALLSLLLNLGWWYNPLKYKIGGLLCRLENIDLLNIVKVRHTGHTSLRVSFRCGLRYCPFHYLLSHFYGVRCGGGI